MQDAPDFQNVTEFAYNLKNKFGASIDMTVDNLNTRNVMFEVYYSTPYDTQTSDTKKPEGCEDNKEYESVSKTPLIGNAVSKFISNASQVAFVVGVYCIIVPAFQNLFSMAHKNEHI